MLSDNINFKEVPRALEKEKKDKAKIFPILVRKGDFKEFPLRRFTFSMPENKSVAEWENRDEAWKLVIQDLKKLINQFTNRVAMRLIEEAKEQHSPILDLGNCGLKDIPQEIFELEWREALLL